MQEMAHVQVYTFIAQVIELIKVGTFSNQRCTYKAKQ